MKWGDSLGTIWEPPFNPSQSSLLADLEQESATLVCVFQHKPKFLPEEEVAVTGRVAPYWDFGDQTIWYFDSRASRFHPASIAGLVVGAMGVFVFGAALKAWLRERKAYREVEE